MRVTSISLQLPVGMIETKISFDSLIPEDKPMRLSSLGSPSAASASSRSTYGSFTAMPMPQIEKKSTSVPHASQKPDMFKISLVFDRPFPEMPRAMKQHDCQLGKGSLGSPTTFSSPLSIAFDTPPLEEPSRALGYLSPRSVSSGESRFSILMTSLKNEVAQLKVAPSGMQSTRTDKVSGAFDSPSVEKAPNHRLSLGTPSPTDTAVSQRKPSFEAVNSPLECCMPPEAKNEPVSLPLSSVGEPSNASDDSDEEVNGMTSTTVPSQTFEASIPESCNERSSLDTTSSPTPRSASFEERSFHDQTSPLESPNMWKLPKTMVSSSPPKAFDEPSTLPENDNAEGLKSASSMMSAIVLDDSCTQEGSVDEQSSMGIPSLTYSSSISMKEPSPRGVVTFPSRSLTSPKAPATMSSSPPKSADEASDIIAMSPSKPVPVKKPNSKFADILNQWKEKSLGATGNGHFLSPPTNIIAPYHSKAVSRTSPRRRSTGNYIAPKPKDESSNPKWSPPSASIRRQSIDISSITIPSKQMSARKRVKDPSETNTRGYWNGMIQKDDTPDAAWAFRSVTRRESTGQNNLMETVPKEDSYSLAKDASMMSDNDDDVPCTCPESVFSGSDPMMEFFLPKLGMAHQCGKRNAPILIDSDPIALHHILRPWQVDFLRSCDIYRADQLVKACRKRAGTLAGAMRKWRLDNGMTCPKSVSCGMALHIWSRTCKYYVRTIRRQLADGMVEVEPPTLGDVMATCKVQAESSFLSTGEEDEHDHSND